jgi:hypothetical protein
MASNRRYSSCRLVASQVEMRTRRSATKESGVSTRMKGFLRSARRSSSRQHWRPRPARAAMGRVSGPPVGAKAPWSITGWLYEGRTFQVAKAFCVGKGGVASASGALTTRPGTTTGSPGSRAATTARSACSRWSHPARLTTARPTSARSATNRTDRSLSLSSRRLRAIWRARNTRKAATASSREE